MTDLNRRIAHLSREERAVLFEKLREQKERAAGTAERIGRRPASAAPPPVSFAQQRLWFIDRLAPGDPAYNVSSAVRITGPLDPEALRRALEAVAARHESLRTTFDLGAGDQGPVQIIAPRLTVDLPVVDLSGLAGREAVMLELCREDSRRAFDLAAGPLLRAMLLRLGSEDCVLVLVMHHIVSDGWSMGVLVRETGALYLPDADLPELPIQYADFAVWQRGWLQGEVLERQIGYWRERLAGAPPALDLPTDRPRPALRTTSGALHRLELPAGRLRHLALQENATPFILLLAGFQTVLSRWSGQEDLCVGTAVANRNRAEISGLIGFFVNNLAMRGDLSGDPPFRELLARTRGMALGAYAHQDLPFEKLVEELRPERDPSRSPLFQVMLVLQNTPNPPLQLGELGLTSLAFEAGTAKLDLTLSLEEEGDVLHGAFSYNTDLFDAATVARLAAHLRRLLAAAVADPARRLSELPLLSGEELDQVLRGWDGEEPSPPSPLPPALTPARERGAPTQESLSPPLPGAGSAGGRGGRGVRVPVHEQFAEWAVRDPDRPAVVFEDRALTYGELHRRASQLALRLRALGVGPEVRVALAVERSLETVVGILGVLAAGGAYVPVDPRLPAERLATLLEQSGAAVVLVGEEAHETVGAWGRPVLVVSEDVEADGALAAAEPAPENAAYVLFTSGSTGSPKGVVVEHRQIAHYVQAVSGRLGLGGGASFALVSTFTADLGNTVLFPSLCGGGCLHVLSPARALDPEAFADYAERHRIDCMKIVPSHLASLLKGSRPELVLPRELLVLGGEAASWELVERVRELAPECRILNHYGPTETTVGVTTNPLDTTPAGRWPRSPALGRPLPGTKILLLGRWGEAVPVGAPGEICVGGAGVARGYLGRPDLTAERFVPDPYAREAGARLYRTGDLARARLQGGMDLEILGRADDQVKVRGFRVEPREIESVLSRHPGVSRCAVLARPDAAGGVSLAAYVEPKEGEATVEELRIFLARSLPAYMVPSTFAILEALPLTANGKLDRQRLSRMETSTGRPGPEVPFSAPRTEVERAIAGIWAEVLGLERVGLQDNFFDLGGHSLLLTQVQRRLREALGRELPLLKLFEFPTVGTLAANLEAGGEDGDCALPAEASRDRALRQRQGIELQRQRLAGAAGRSRAS